MDIVKELTDHGDAQHGTIITGPDGAGIGIELTGGDGHTYRFASTVPPDVTPIELDALAMILKGYAEEKAAL